MTMINLDEMIKSIILPSLSESEVDKRIVVLDVFEKTVAAHNQPKTRDRYDVIEQIVADYEWWNEFELTDFIHYLLRRIDEEKRGRGIPAEIKLKLTRIICNRVICIVRMDMCAKTTAEMYELASEDYAQQLEEVVNEEDVIDNPTFEDLAKLDV